MLPSVERLKNCGDSSDTWGSSHRYIGIFSDIDRIVGFEHYDNAIVVVVVVVVVIVVVVVVIVVVVDAVVADAAMVLV